MLLADGGSPTPHLASASTRPLWSATVSSQRKPKSVVWRTYCPLYIGANALVRLTTPLVVTGTSCADRDALRKASPRAATAMTENRPCGRKVFRGTPWLIVWKVR